jgi:hypothetical protein
MESIWSPDGVYMESITQLSKYALSCVLCGLYVDFMWTLVESIWSYGVHMESMGQSKVHFIKLKLLLTDISTYSNLGMGCLM